MPDWPTVHRELRRKGVTLQLLHLEYKEQHPDGYQYTQFCRHYRAWQGRLDLVMRQEHRAGEKLFVDFAGQTIPIVDPETGEISEAQLFVAVLGASNYTYAEACASQSLPDWIAAHVHAVRFFGGCCAILVPDNLRSGVTRPHRYEPELNRTYEEMAAHYGCVVIPAGPGSHGTRRRPRWAFWWPSDGSWRRSASAPSSASPRPMPRSPSGAAIDERPFRNMPGLPVPGSRTGRSASPRRPQASGR